MNSEQRRAARRKRREEKRAKAKAERVKACTLETVADLNSLCKASKQAARGVMWKSSTQRYMRSYLRNAVLSRRDLLEGRDICRGFIRFDLWERGKLRHISAVHFPERVVALEHRLIDAQGDVGLGLGSEPNQICAVAHPNRIDHYVVEMLRPESCGRYMDDFYLIHESKDYLQVCLLLMERKCAELGIELNPRKTRVVKLTRGFTWLKKRIFYAEAGRIVVKPCCDSITRERRKLKKMARMVADGAMTPEQVEHSYQSWRGGMKRLDAHRSVRAMDALYRSLFENLAEGGVLKASLFEGRQAVTDINRMWAAA